MNFTLIFFITVGGLPFFQFFPSDYLRDTRALSCAAKGGWTDVLCHLHASPTRGKMTLPMIAWARAIGATVDETEAIIAELDSTKVAEVERNGNGSVTLSCRRMLRDSITREQTRLRVQKHRNTGRCNGNSNTEITGKKPETRSHKSESEEESLRSSSSAEPAKPASAGGNGELPLGPLATNPETDPVAMTFPTVGNLAEWPLRLSKVAEYRTTFPGVDVDAALLQARQWCADNAKQRKTAAGMPKFLFGWLERRQNRSGPGQPPPRGASWR